MLLCGRSVLPHRGAGRFQRPTSCLYLPRSPTISQFSGIYKEIFRTHPKAPLAKGRLPLSGGDGRRPEGVGLSARRAVGIVFRRSRNVWSKPALRNLAYFVCSLREHNPQSAASRLPAPLPKEPPLRRGRGKLPQSRFARQLPQRGSLFYSSSSLSTAIKASVGSCTVPRVRIFFLPSFCFSSSFFFRVISPP